MAKLPGEGRRAAHAEGEKEPELISYREELDPEFSLLAKKLDRTLHVAILLSEVISVGVILVSVLLHLGGTPTVWQFISAALAAVLIVALVFLDHFRKLVVRQELRWLITASPKIVYEIMARACGIARDDYVKTLTIRTDGSATNINEYTIRAVTQEVNWVDQQTTLPDYDDPEGGKLINLITPCIVRAGRTVEIQRLPGPGGRSVVYKILFRPPIAKGDSFRLAGMHSELPKMTYRMNLADLGQMDCEWTALKVQYPSNRLEMQVRFADGYEPDGPRFAVWYGDAKLEHVGETRRIDAKGWFHFAPRSDVSPAQMSLIVEYPIPGLRYVIKWRPDPTARRETPTRGIQVENAP